MFSFLLCQVLQAVPRLVLQTIFSAVITATIDETSAFLSPTAVDSPDPELTFFKNVLKSSDTDILMIAISITIHMVLISLTHLQMRRMNVSFRMQG